jgi:hypothetical protein
MKGGGGRGGRTSRNENAGAGTGAAAGAGLGFAAGAMSGAQTATITSCPTSDQTFTCKLTRFFNNTKMIIGLIVIFIAILWILYMGWTFMKKKK